ncbi:MAG: fumarylacetoacetate hydrolase family protein, partial [Planctomycetota bacterium]
GIDIHLFVDIQSAKMRETDHAAQTIVRSNFRHMYWNMCQMLAHQTITGCNVNPGDIYGSGTVSGPEKESRGCLLELCWRGQEPITLPGTNEKRAFLADGDNVILRGFAGGDPKTSTHRIGFGECAGVVLPARG